MKQLLEYPKFLALLASFVLAYLLFHVGAFDALEQFLDGYGYVSMFLGGLLFSFGFTTPFAIGIFVATADHVHPVPGALIAGIGALLVDLTIFEFIRFEFLDEIRKLKTTALIMRARAWMHHESIPERIREYMFWGFAGLIIASPLPDELGVTMISSITELEEKKFGMFCFVMNTIGVFVILLLAGAR